MRRVIDCWQLTSPGAPLERARRTADEPSEDHVVVRVAGCGVCHTDLGFLFVGIRTRHPLPLTLGHEISGVVEWAADASLRGQPVVVPAVLPCGDCAPCRAGRGAICATQVFPGNDDHVDLADLAVVADAVTTPYQAILNADLRAGDVAVFVGVGGVGAFGVQIAAALGAHVVALDIDPVRLERAAAHGAQLALLTGDDPRALKKQLRAWAKEQAYPTTQWKIFETSGHPAGQELAFSLLNHGAHLGVVGYTRAKTSLRLSNLMAFDATARGTWGCLPEHYPAVVELVLSGAVTLDPFLCRRPMSSINETLRALHAGELTLRPVLIPDFGAAS